MLSNLYIENIAVIEKTTIDFSEGLNVLTGETGAGKSIIIDAINAILGNRTSRDLIRNGCESAFVSAEFVHPSEQAAAVLKEYGFEPEEDTVLIQRELHLSGKGRCRINGRPAAVSTLKAVGIYLMNIHGQHESYELMSPERHIRYIDTWGEHQEELAVYQQSYQHYQTLKSQLEKAGSDEAERERRLDLLRYQIDELEKADLTIGEYEDLLEERKRLENRERIAAALNEAKEWLNGSDESDGAVQMTESAAASLQDIVSVYSDVESIAERLQSAVYELEDCCNELLSMTEAAEDNEVSLEEIEDRIDLIHRLGRKYGTTIEEMLDFLAKARQERDYLEKYEENREALQEEYQAAYQKTAQLAKTLSSHRKATAQQFSAAVKQEMAFLDMPHVEVVVQQENCPLNRNGCDAVEILISTNPGEDPKPVAKIASGGELSRMMLAIKNVLADKDDIDTLIFDEVDTGISGSASQKVGMKLKEVAHSRQVLCVTHQAQIAALADEHFKIAKTVADGKTYTKVTPLDFEGRRSELARIIGGVEITKATLDYAEELLTQH